MKCFWTGVALLLLVLLAACDVGPKLDFDFGEKCTLDCPCRKDTDCTASTCRIAVCNAGTCSSKPSPDGPSSDDRTGDCADITCEGGKPIYTFVPTDLPRRRACYGHHCEPGATAKDKPRVVTDVEPAGTMCALSDDGGTGQCEGTECTPIADAGTDAPEDATTD